MSEDIAETLQEIKLQKHSMRFFLSGFFSDDTYNPTQLILIYFHTENLLFQLNYRLLIAFIRNFVMQQNNFQ